MASGEPRIVGLLLAAGSGQRFGSDKRLYPLADGQPMAVAAATRLHAACDRLVAVVRPEDETLAALLIEVGCEVVTAPDADQGMGASLAAGVRATADADGWIVALADMPFIKRSSHQLILSRLRSGATLVATQYLGRRGHPVGFSKQWLSQLIRLSGDQGGKAILDAHPENLVLCLVDDSGVIRDIDYPGDLAE